MERPVLLDEWQNVPEILGAVKRSVDGGAPPGSYILAGSVRAELEQESWPLTGRAVRLQMHGLSEREVTGAIDDGSPGPLERLLAADADALTLPGTVPDLPGYIERALRGSFPEPALHLHSDADRHQWLDSYLLQLLSRDTLVADSGRDPARLRPTSRRSPPPPPACRPT